MKSTQAQDWSIDAGSEQGMESLIAAPSSPQRRVPQQPQEPSLSTVHCPVCTSEVPSSESTVLSPCGHCFCRPCLRDYLTQKICERTVNLTCPYYQCRTKIAAGLIQQAVENDVFEKWCRFEKIESLQKDFRLRWCPRPDCEGFDYGGENRRMLTCQTCGFAYCYLCNEEWHGDKLCKETLQPPNIKFCPRCSIKVEYVGGCDRMRCRRCDYQWCWLCGKSFSTFHTLTCDFSKAAIRKPSFSLICQKCFMPLLLLCFIVYLNLKLGISLINRCPRYHKQLISAPIVMVLMILSVLLLPLAVAFYMVFTGVFWLRNTVSHSGTGVLSRLATHKRLWCLCSLALGLLISPIIDVSLLLYCASGPVVGLALLVWKAVSVCRKEGPVAVKDPVPGYPIGR